MKYYIYKFYCKDTNITDFYIGSTNNLTYRMRNHKYCCNNIKSIYHNQYKYQFIRNNGGWDNWTYEIIEEFECDSKRNAEVKEQEYISNQKPTLNALSAVYDIEKRKAYQKTYYKDRAEYYSNYYKEYNKKKKELKEKVFQYNNNDGGTSSNQPNLETNP